MIQISDFNKKKQQSQPVDLFTTGEIVVNSLIGEFMVRLSFREPMLALRLSVMII